MNNLDHSSVNKDASIRHVLERHPGIRLAVMFGSLASNSAHRDSDLDLAVGGESPLDADEKKRLIAELAEATGRPIDLVDLATVGEPLLGQILKGGKRLLGEDDRFAALLLKHLFDEVDFMPLRRRILEERRKAWIGI